MDLGDTLWDAAKGIVGTVAPTVATALLGPLGGMAVKEIGKALGLPDTASSEDVATAITNATPEQLVQLKSLENDFKIKMKELDVDLVRISAADRDSARNREIQTKDWTPKVLAFAITILYICIQIFMISGTIIPAEMREMVMRALGTLDAILSLVFSYYFGSSSEMTTKK